jgi:RNA polymerase sigma-70 factor (sigma-E family)
MIGPTAFFSLRLTAGGVGVCNLLAAHRVEEGDRVAGGGVAGDDLEFRDFFLAEFERLSRLGLLLTGSWSEGEELAQEALARTYRQWPRVRRGGQHPGAYARRVLVNRHRSLLRRALVEARHALRTHAAEGYQPDLGEDAMVLWAAVRRLPERQRAVLVLRYYEDLPEAEVARLLRLPLGTVKSLAHRALARLRAELERPASARAIQRRRGQA